MDFKELLKPYKEGGNADNPSERTIGTIMDYLLNKKMYQMDIVGGAIFLVFNYLNSGGEFKGDGSYGSKGRELVTSIRMKCDELQQQRIEGVVYQMFMENYAEDLRSYILPKQKQKFMSWWRGKDVFT